MQNASIKNWAVDDRPREKLILKGAEALSDSELLAILINSGTKDASAVHIARELLHKTGNDLKKLSRLSVEDIQKLNIKGLGRARAITLAAAAELGFRRLASETIPYVIKQPEDAAKFLQAKIGHKNIELFVVMFLNNANRVNHHMVLSEGGLSGTVADPRIIFKAALQYNATSIILCHNHPSGNVKPSRADEQLTQSIKTAAEMLQIKLLDHIIVSDENYFSFQDEGLL